MQLTLGFLLTHVDNIMDITVSRMIFRRPILGTSMKFHLNSLCRNGHLFNSHLQGQ